MIPTEKVREIISRHKTLEKELSSDQIDKKKFAKISKEYSDLNEIINKDVPMATFIFNPYNKIKDGTIKNPPPAPTRPVRDPTPIPSRTANDELNFLFTLFFMCFFFLII